MKFDFMGTRGTFFALSGTLIVMSVILMIVRGFNYGIDFKGGNIIQVRFNEVATESKIREVFGKIPNLYFSPDQLVIQSVSGSGGKEFLIQYPASGIESAEYAQLNSNILKKLKEEMPYADDALAVSNVGPTVGSEMRRQAGIAAILSVIGILIYLAWRFEVQSASGAVLAIVHDLLITLGFISLTSMELDITVLAAILTLLGYSVNDSIVVLDRIRENRKLMRGKPLFDIINDSINQTLGRTINTSLTTLFTLVALLLFGGTSIHNFAATLTFGIIIGTYSSISIASPVLLHFGPGKLEKKR